MANGKEPPTIQERKWTLWANIRRDPDLSPTSKLIANVLVDYFNVEKGYAWPPIESIAEAIGRAPRTVERNLPKLIGRYFNYRQGGGRQLGGNGKSNEYIPLWETPSEVSGYLKKKDKKEVDTPTKLAKNPDKVVGNTPSDVSDHTFNNTFIGERVPSPPEGGSALSKKKDCLQKTCLESSPSLPPRLPSLKSSDGISKANKAEATARHKLAGSLGWDVLMAADNVGDENHFSAVEACRREAERLGVVWRLSAKNLTEALPFQAARVQPYLEAVQAKGFTPDVALAEMGIDLK